MKPTIKKTLLIILVSSLGVLLLGKLLLPPLLGKFVAMDVLYAEYSMEKMMRDADYILVGQVVAVSETRWNQNSGQFWVDGLPYHVITLSVNQSIVGEATEQVEITIISSSPQDATPVLLSDHALTVGDEVVVFAGRTELAWRQDSRRPILALMGSPSASILLKSDDGLYYSVHGEGYSLPELADEVARLRTMP